MAPSWMTYIWKHPVSQMFLIENLVDKKISDQFRKFVFSEIRKEVFFDSWKDVETYPDHYEVGTSRLSSF